MYKAITQILSGDTVIASGESFQPEDFDFTVEELARLVKIGAITHLEPDPVDAEESAVETDDGTKRTRKRTK